MRRSERDDGDPRALQEIYNAALQERREAWKLAQVVSYYDQQNELTELRQDDDFMDRGRVISARSAAPCRPGLQGILSAR